MKLTWFEGNRCELLENGDEYFPAVLKAIDAARSEVTIETFILFEDRVGLALHQCLLNAAGRGVKIDLTVDDFGSPGLSDDFIGALTEAGVRLHVFNPGRPLLGKRFNLLHRLHRKIVVVDRQVAFVGGINFSQDHLLDDGPEAKQDYSLRLEGPVVQAIHADTRQMLAPVWQRLNRRFNPRHWRAPPAVDVGETPAPAGTARAAFIKRDNARHPIDIERWYRHALTQAREEVLIANAYFFPGYRFLRAMRHAVRRGVRVRLLLQGQPDVWYARASARLLYGALIRDGVDIHEYCQRPLHGKVAVIDRRLVTVGSSNLDPLSLALNLEANVVVEDPALGAELHQRLTTLIEHHCQQRAVQQAAKPNMWRYAVGALAYHAVRLFPRWLPRVVPRRLHIRSFLPGRVVDTPAGPDDLAGPSDADAGSPQAEVREAMQEALVRAPQAAPPQAPRRSSLHPSPGRAH